MHNCCFKVESFERGEAKLKETLTNGDAVKKFPKMIFNQKVDGDTVEALCAKEADVWTILPKSKFRTVVKSPKSGTFTLDIICNNFRNK